MQRMAQPGNRQSIQREALPDEEEELQMKSLDNRTLQREVLPEDEEELQMKSLDNRTLQREALPEDEEELQMKSLDNRRLQREALPEDEEELQMKPSQGEAGMAAAPDLEASINQARGGGQAIADNIREPMEVAFGADFSGVKVHTDGQSDQLNRSIQARAFTTGQDVFFRQGEYNPGSRGGQELLAHELTHVVQQKGIGTEIERQTKPLLQRKIAWGKDTEYLLIENLEKDNTIKVPNVYKNQLEEVVKLEAEVQVTAEIPGSGSASYSYDEEQQKGIIKVGVIDKDYDTNAKRSVLKSKIIAMTHEMQHALDDLKKGSPQEGKLRGKGGDEEWYDKIMSELNAHAVQAMIGKEMIDSGETISQNNEILTKGFNEEGFKVGGTMFEKLVLYFSQYYSTMQTGLNEKDPNKTRTEQVSQFLFLNWGEVKDLIDRVHDSTTVAAPSLPHKNLTGKRKRE
ncbi:DUF4157 domain-containing protein [Nostoc sp. C057]|nr:DUF4157 domain-containing protein [Nostoc sp. C057]